MKLRLYRLLLLMPLGEQTGTDVENFHLEFDSRYLRFGGKLLAVCID
jgi:hypothetical protein